jgi:hypothetical protein
MGSPSELNVSRVFPIRLGKINPPSIQRFGSGNPWCDGEASQFTFFQSRRKIPVKAKLTRYIVIEYFLPRTVYWCTASLCQTRYQPLVAGSRLMEPLSAIYVGL